MPDIFVSEDNKEGQTKSTKLDKKKKSHAGKHARHPKYKNNPLSSFMYYPRKAEFFNKDNEEEIILILRKHPITNLRWIFLGGLMLLAPSLLNFFPILDFLPETYQLVAVLGWYLITIAYLFEEFLGWFFNVNIITDERIFDVDFVNLVYRKITDANLDNIEEVTVTVGSAIHTMFNYGNVIVTTASEMPEIDMISVPRPDRVANILRELRVEEEEEKLEGRVR